MALMMIIHTLTPPPQKQQLSVLAALLKALSQTICHLLLRPPHHYRARLKSSPRLDSQPSKTGACVCVCTGGDNKEARARARLDRKASGEQLLFIFTGAH